MAQQDYYTPERVVTYTLTQLVRSTGLACRVYKPGTPRTRWLECTHAWKPESVWEVSCTGDTDGSAACRLREFTTRTRLVADQYWSCNQKFGQCGFSTIERGPVW